MIPRLAMLVLFVAGSAFAQEFGRADGGDLQMQVKQPGGFSGSLGFSLSKGDFASTSKGFTGALGGALIADKLWFFATAQHDRQYVSATPQLNDRQVLAAAAGTGREQTPALTVPTSFLSMRYTGMLSSSSYFTANVTTRRTTAEPTLTVFH
jgi:hypothetical protein